MSAAFAQVFGAGHFQEGMTFAVSAPQLDAEADFSPWLSPATHIKCLLSESIVCRSRHSGVSYDRNLLESAHQVTEVTNGMERAEGVRSGEPTPMRRIDSY